MPRRDLVVEGDAALSVVERERAVTPPSLAPATRGVEEDSRLLEGDSESPTTADNLKGLSATLVRPSFRFSKCF